MKISEQHVLASLYDQAVLAVLSEYLFFSINIFHCGQLDTFLG